MREQIAQIGVWGGTVGSRNPEIDWGSPAFVTLIPWSKEKRSLGDVEYAGKVKTQIFKQYQQELLIKSKVMPASKLAETAKRNAKLPPLEMMDSI